MEKPNKKPFWKKWWVWLILGLILFYSVVFSAINPLKLIEQAKHTQSGKASNNSETVSKEYKDSLAKMFCDKRSDGERYLSLQYFLDNKIFELTTEKPLIEACRAVTDWCLKAWNKQECEDIANKKIWIGMTGLQLGWSWGIPQDKNNTTNAYGIHSQWVYGNLGPYVYLEGKTDSLNDMKVTSWQD